MTDKHTPGPYRYRRDERLIVTNGDGMLGKLHIAEMCSQAEDTNANGSLLAAAPLMLEALRGLTGQYVAFVSEGAAQLPPEERENFLRFHAERTDAALDAIAAATGEANA